MTEQARLQQLEQFYSRKVNVTPRDCDCVWCTTGPRRAKSLLLNVVGRALTVKEIHVS